MLFRSAYPDTAVTVTGTVMLSPMTGTDVMFSWELSNLEANLCDTVPAGVGNACGIHIHVGKTCNVAADVGGHYYNSTLTSDPWSPITYTTAAGSTDATGTSTVSIGEADIEGRAFVVHDSTGARTGCGLIAAAQLARIMGRVVV